MRVALVSLLPRGGPVEQALLLAGELQRRGSRVKAIVSDRSVGERFADAGCTVSLIPSGHWFDPRGGYELLRSMRGADVVHAHDRRAALWVRLLPRPSRSGVRIHTAHGIADPFLPESARPREPNVRDYVAYHGLDASLARRADAIIVPSKAVAEDLVERFRYPRDRVEVVPNGIAPSDPVDARGGYVATLTVMERYKALDVYVRAVARLADSRPDVRFAMFGTGSQQEALDALCEELGVADRIHRPGFVPAHEALAGMRMFVMSSRWENAPIALLEAMAAGIPVVSTSVYGIPEIATDDTAQLVPPDDPVALADAIAELLDHPEMAQAKAAAGRERVMALFTAEANGRRIAEVYERARERRRGRVR